MVSRAVIYCPCASRYRPADRAIMALHPGAWRFFIKQQLHYFTLQPHATQPQPSTNSNSNSNLKHHNQRQSKLCHGTYT